MQYAKPVTLNVEECDRLSFLPYLFGQDFLYAEASVNALAKQMMPEYEGGFWHFIRLPDGGGYMMPDGDRFHMVNGANWFDRNHYQNRLIYERAMLDESGGVVTRTQDFEPGGQVFSRGEWLTIIRVNKSNGAVSSVTTPNYSFLGYSGTMKVTPDRITDYKAPSAEEAAVASQAAKRPPVVNYPGEGFREMTKAQWAALPRDCKAVRSVAEAEDHGTSRHRRSMENNFCLVNVYITDMKITEIPQK